MQIKYFSKLAVPSIVLINSENEIIYLLFSYTNVTTISGRFLTLNVANIVYIF